MRISLRAEAVKAQECCIHTYPLELARTIAARWTIAPEEVVLLPPEDALSTLFSEAYQASLLTRLACFVKKTAKSLAV